MRGWGAGPCKTMPCGWTREAGGAGGLAVWDGGGGDMMVGGWKASVFEWASAAWSSQLPVMTVWTGVDTARGLAAGRLLLETYIETSLHNIVLVKRRRRHWS